MSKRYGVPVPSRRLSAWCAVQAEVNYPLAGKQPQSRLFVGLVVEEAIGGAPFLRIDIPAIDEAPERTLFISPMAVKVLEPMTEEQAREILKGRIRAALKS